MLSMLKEQINKAFITPDKPIAALHKHTESHIPKRQHDETIAAIYINLPDTQNQGITLRRYLVHLHL